MPEAWRLVEDLRPYVVGAGRIDSTGWRRVVIAPAEGQRAVEASESEGLLALTGDTYLVAIPFSLRRQRSRLG